MSSSIYQRIGPKQGLLDLNLGEIWAHRELLFFLALNEIKIRYKQTAIGVLWAVLQPLLTMVIFTVVFGNIAKVDSDGIPYPIFSFTGLILWTYFSTSLTLASMSLVTKSNMISKVYFPRLVLPLSACLVGLLDYCISAFILMGLMVYYSVTPTIWLFLAPVPLVLSFLLAAGIGFWLSSICVKYRDVQYAAPFFIQLLLYVSPIIYSVKIAGSYSWLLNLNPLTGIMTTQRALILGNTGIDWVSLGLSAAITLAIFLTGLVYFKRTERAFADVI